MLDIMPSRDEILLSTTEQDLVDLAGNQGPTMMFTQQLLLPTRPPTILAPTTHHHSMSSSPCTTPRASSFSFNLNTNPTMSPVSFFPRIPPQSLMLLHHYQRSRCHIASLPTELLSHIFTLTTHSKTDSALELSHVSRHWRAVAIKTTALWSTIDILRRDPSRPTETKHRLQKLFLSRAPTGPLTINIYVAIPPVHKRIWDEDRLNLNWFGSQDMSDILSWLLPFSMDLKGELRWSSLSLMADTFAPIHTFLEQTSQLAAPRLTSMRLVRCNPYHAEVFPFHPISLKDPIKLFAGGPLPKLKEATFDGVHVDWDDFASSVSPSGNLESFTLNFHAGSVRPALPSFISIASSPKLSSLTIHGSGPLTLPPPSSEPTILLSSLKELKVKYHSPTYAGGLISSFSLPSLEKLHLGDINRSPEYGTQREPSSDLFSSIIHHRQFGKLNEVWMTDVEAPVESFVELLSIESMKTVETLGIKSMNKQVVAALAKDEVLPVLKDLYTVQTPSMGVVRPEITLQTDAENPIILQVLEKHFGMLERLHYHYSEVPLVPEGTLDQICQFVEVRRWGDGMVSNDEGVKADEEEEEEGDEEDEEMEMIDDEFLLRQADEEDEMDQGVEWADIPLPYPLPNFNNLLPADDDDEHPTPANSPLKNRMEHRGEDEDDLLDSDDESCPDFGRDGDGASTSGGTTVSGYPPTRGTSLCGGDDDLDGLLDIDAEGERDWSWEEREY